MTTPCDCAERGGPELCSPTRGRFNCGGRYIMPAVPPGCRLAQPSCRYCREPVIRGVPCSCDRAQKEAASIMAGTER